jgi:phenylpropionate dioxygenase-like ring-hydroxylating dioxygenase large terminal subunit
VDAIAIPGLGSLPLYPRGWQLFGSLATLRRGPVTREVSGRRVVGFLTAGGQVGMLDAQCCHMGSDLGCGRVVGETIECSFHNWRFGRDGQCVEIPAQPQIPPFARQSAWSVRVRNGQVFVCPGRELYPLPWFDGCDPDDFVAAPPFIEEIACPWYLPAANAFDMQHFKGSHDRRLLGTPRIEQPHPCALRNTCRFAIEGTAWSDRVTRAFGGDEVEMQMTVWSGSVVLVRATLARAQSFGVVHVTSLAPDRMRAQITVFARRSSGLAGAALDWLRTRVRRVLIQRFLASDRQRIAGCRYSPATAIEADADMVRFFEWLRDVNSGKIAAPHYPQAEAPQLAEAVEG